MNEPTTPPSNLCPSCQEPTEPQWSVCPYCGLRLKPSDDLFVRTLAWLAVLVAFVLGAVAIYGHDQDSAAAYLVIFGLPLAYIFGKAVLFRVQGRPLTWRQLGKTTMRAGIISFLVLVVAPIVLGIAIILLLFAVCVGMGVMGR